MNLPLTTTATPQSQDELSAIVAEAYATETPLYPIGGGTSLDYGLPVKAPGLGLALGGLSRVIDFPARDLTITVEAGITMQSLAETLAGEGLRLPIDVPQPRAATLGGVIATAWSGPRRLGDGTIRDWVIGIRAVDGRGEVFNGGGRVVKNVAGYDFCKLLTGSLGTLGVITQATLKVRPLAQQTSAVTIAVASLPQLDDLLNALAQSDLTPAAVEYFSTPQRAETIMLFEGTQAEVEWQLQQLQILLSQRQLSGITTFAAEAEAVIQRLTEFPSTSAALVLKASVRPSGITRFIAGLQEIDSHASITASAASGIVYAALDEFPKQGLSRTVVGQLQPLAASLGGNLVVLSNPSGQEATAQSTWGNVGGQLAIMQAVKEQFDPRNVLNPGRFVV